MVDANFTDSVDRFLGAGSETARVYHHPDVTEEQRQSILETIPLGRRLLIDPNPVRPVPGRAMRVVTRQPQASLRNPFGRANDEESDDADEEATFAAMLRARAIGVRSGDSRSDSPSSASATAGTSQPPLPPPEPVGPLRLDASYRALHMHFVYKMGHFVGTDDDVTLAYEATFGIRTSGLLWSARKCDFEPIHGIYRCTKLIPDKLATAYAIAREENRNEAGFLPLLVADLARVYQGQVREREDRYRHRERTPMAGTVDEHHTALFMIPRIPSMPESDLPQLPQAPLSLEHSIDYMIEGLEMLAQMADQCECLSFLNTATDFIQNVDWIRLMCVGYLEVAHTTMVTNPGLRSSIVETSRLRSVESTMQRMLRKTLSTEFDELVYEHLHNTLEANY